MIPLHFEIHINASSSKVWSTLWEEHNYRKWAESLNKGSYYKGDLSKGSKIYFFDSNQNGMYNLVVENRPNKEMTFKHLGWMENAQESPQSWIDSMEQYLLNENKDGTLLRVKVQALEEFSDFFQKKYPSMLLAIKELAES